MLGQFSTGAPGADATGGATATLHFSDDKVHASGGAPLTLEHALVLAQAALRAAQDRNLAPLCVTVLDAGGHSLATLRHERASHYRHVIASAKAAGCLGMGIGGREIARRAAAMPEFYASVTAMTGGGLAPVAGGVLIRDHAGQLVGAVGISGDTADNDELCAVFGINAAGFVADTGAMA